MAISGSHTTEQVQSQMGLLRELRGPRAHAQLIGGEVSLLPAENHAEALHTMLEHGREPMSMTHSDFDYDYLTTLALDAGGHRRFRRLSFAGHFDMMMYGRRGIKRPASEGALNPYRAAFVDMLRRLRREHGVHYFLAHNMTVTPTNLDQIPDMIRDCHGMGFGLFSFQPAAFVGDDRRWHEDYRDATADEVWARIEAGVGTRLPFRALLTGDERCNRTTYGCYVGPDYFPILDDEKPADLRVRDAFLKYFGGVSFSGTPPPLLAVKVLRVLLRHPIAGWIAAGWAARMLRATGARRLLT